MYYYLSIGTNLKPEFNAAQIIQLLARHFREVQYFPFVYTQPHGMRTRNTFLNSAAIIESSLEATAFKQKLNQIETELGRDRNDPLRSTKDRTADIDILGTTDQLLEDYFDQFDESYIRGVVTPAPQARFADLSAYQIPNPPFSGLQRYSY